MAELHRVVIRRQKPHEEEYHGGNWKIAYADFMTAMMAFFLVMWILTLVPKDELSTIAEYFRQPLIAKIKGEETPSRSSNIIPGGSPSIIPSSHGSNVQTPQALGRLDEMTEMVQREQQSLENLKERLETLIATNPRLVEFRPQMVLDMTPEGLRIQIVDGQNRPMFATGSARMNRDMEQILTELAPTLNAVPNGLSIAGHTDATQYATGDRYYSNWELSADRANAARKSLVAGGIGERKVHRVMGLAEHYNADPDPMAHANRRISIVVLNRQSSDIMRQTYATDQAAPPQATDQPAPPQKTQTHIQNPPSNEVAPLTVSNLKDLGIPTLEQLNERARAGATPLQ